MVPRARGYGGFVPPHPNATVRIPRDDSFPGRGERRYPRAPGPVYPRSGAHSAPTPSAGSTRRHANTWPSHPPLTSTRPRVGTSTSSKRSTDHVCVCASTRAYRPSAHRRSVVAAAAPRRRSRGFERSVDPSANPADEAARGGRCHATRVAFGTSSVRTPAEEEAPRPARRDVESRGARRRRRRATRDTRRTPPRGSSAEARETPGPTRRPEGRKTRSRWDPDVARSNPAAASSIFFRARRGASGDAGTRASGNAAGAGASGNASDPSKATRSSHHARARRRRRRAGVSARDDPNAAAEASVITTRGVRRLGDGASRGASSRAPRASTGGTTEPGRRLGDALGGFGDARRDRRDRRDRSRRRVGSIAMDRQRGRVVRGLDLGPAAAPGSSSGRSRIGGARRRKPNAVAADDRSIAPVNAARDAAVRARSARMVAATRAAALDRERPREGNRVRTSPPASPGLRGAASSARRRGAGRRRRPGGSESAIGEAAPVAISEVVSRRFVS